MSSSSRFAGAVASPRLTPEIVHELRIKIMKAAFPIIEMPAPKRQLTDPPTIKERPQWEVDGFWFANFGDLIEDELKIPHSTNDDNLELLKASGQGAPGLTQEEYCQGLLASMAARVLPNTLVRLNPNSLYQPRVLTSPRFKFSAPRRYQRPCGSWHHGL